MKKIILVLCALVIPVLAPAATGESDSLLLIRLAAWLHADDGFAMSSRVEIYPEADSSERKTMNMVNYGSDSAFIRYANSSETEMLVCRKGYFKVDKIHRKAYVMQYASDTSWQSDQQRLSAQNMNALMDDYFFKDARILKRTVNGGVETFHLGYPSGGAVIELRLSFALTDHRIQRAEYVLRRSAGPGVLSREWIIQRVVIDKYTRRRPQELQDALAGSNDLTRYLSARYPGFEIQTI